jgi:hypothetical protein
MKTTHTSGNVKGWAIDADRANDPTFPIRKRLLDAAKIHEWRRPAQQQADGVEILHSNERPGLSSVYGTSCPPSGLSGMLRRMAFRHSESSYAHWLPLMLADRIGMLGGLLEDLAHGHLPNIPRELGWKVEWRYNKTNLLSRIAMRTVLMIAVVGGFWLLACHP